MPRTSYALKTFGSSIGRMLTATTCCAALVVPLASAAAPPTPAVVAIQATRPNPGERPELTLVKFDPASLAERGHASLGRHYLPYGYAYSPDRKRIVILGSAEGVLLHIDLRTMQLTGEATVPRMGGMGLIWTGPETIIGLHGRTSPDAAPSISAYRLDPYGRQVTEIWNAPERHLGRSRGRNGTVVLLTSPAHEQPELGGPLRVVTLGASGVRWSTTLGEIRLGLENWRVPADGQLPPVAARLVERARDDLAARTGVPTSEIAPFSVVPRDGTNNLIGTSYEIVLAARGEYYRYLVFLVGQDPDLRTPTHLPAAPPASENNLLRAPAGSWEVRHAQLMLAPSRRRAFIVTSGSVVARIDLATRQIRHSTVSPEIGWSAVLDEKRLVVATARGVGIARFGSPRIRLIQRGSDCVLARAQSSFLVFGWGCRGLTVYGLGGVRRHRLLRSERLADADVTVAGRFAYVRNPPTYDKLRVVDVLRGRVLRTASPRFDGLLMISG